MRTLARATIEITFTESVLAEIERP